VTWPIGWAPPLPPPAPVELALAAELLLVVPELVVVDPPPVLPDDAVPLASDDDEAPLADEASELDEPHAASTIESAASIFFMTSQLANGVPPGQKTAAGPNPPYAQ